MCNIDIRCVLILDKGTFICVLVFMHVFYLCYVTVYAYDLCMYA